MKIRIKFEKHGAMKFIGHLDIMRYFQKAMRRADVDIRYSEGFSPHQVMSFAAPLGVGLTSGGEYMDIEVLTSDNSAAMIKRLNEVMVDGVKVLSYRKLDDSAKNAMSIVAAADYTLTFRESCRPQDISGFLADFTEFIQQDSITITKKTKKSEREVDIRPMIYDMHIDGETIWMKLSTGSVDNIKPDLVMDAFYQKKGMEMPAFAFQIQREEVYAELGEAGSHDFVALEALGEEIE